MRRTYLFGAAENPRLGLLLRCHLIGGVLVGSCQIEHVPAQCLIVLTLGSLDQLICVSAVAVGAAGGVVGN